MSLFVRFGLGMLVDAAADHAVRQVNVADMRRVIETLKSIESRSEADFGPLKRFLESLNAQMTGTSDGPIRRAMRRWAARYRSFTQERFDRFSKGGGDWKPLEASTIRRRRKGIAKIAGAVKGGPALISSSPAILKDTGILFAALAGGAGSYEEHVPGGVWVGFGGGATHKKGHRTIADIAAMHDSGMGVPKREILVEPPAAVTAAMQMDYEQALEEQIRMAGTVKTT